VTWVDSHCHVSADAFDADRAETLSRAREGGVEAMIAIGAGWGVEANGPAVELAAREPDVWATVGVHPHDAKLLDDGGRRRLREWLGAPRVVAVGECGLDYWYDHSPRDLQRRVFGEQLALARELGLPVTLHVRDRGGDAYEEVLGIWRSEGGGALEGVLHCYTHDLPFAKRALDAGLLVSFSGIVTFRNADALREVAAALPLDRLLVETDAPLLAPEGHRGERNEPLRVGLVGACLAQVRGEALEAVAAATSANARRLFRLPEPT
jgi:TatD DNase family protein